MLEDEEKSEPESRWSILFHSLLISALIWYFRALVLKKGRWKDDILKQWEDDDEYEAKKLMILS